ncbi:MAG: dipeptidase [Pseudomonadota bacterium]
MRKGLIHGSVTLIVVCVIVVLMLPSWVEDSMNVVLRDETWPVGSRAQTLHNNLRVADLHADTMLWNRDFLTRGSIGHVDLPRLQQGNVVLQVMSVVTKSPSGQNYERNSSDAADTITTLTVVQLWPMRTWSSLLERARYQAQRLHRFAERSPDLRVITSAAELKGFLSGYQSGQVATLLATEGAHPLEGDLGNLRVLFDDGYRMLGLQHFFDNEIGGSLHGESNEGLTEFGRQVVKAAVAMGYIIDVAHSSPATVDDVLALIDDPVVVSHTGLQGACDSPRNLTDQQMQKIAAAGGLIGVGFWDAVCNITPQGVAQSIKYAVDLLGVDHVALGSDYDGSTTVTFDAGDLAVLTQALLDVGLSEADIRQVMGENQLAFLARHLPQATDS